MLTFWGWRNFNVDEMKKMGRLRSVRLSNFERLPGVPMAELKRISILLQFAGTARPASPHQSLSKTEAFFSTNRVASYGRLVSLTLSEGTGTARWQAFGDSDDPLQRLSRRNEIRSLPTDGIVLPSPEKGGGRNQKAMRLGSGGIEGHTSYSCLLTETGKLSLSRSGIVIPPKGEVQAGLKILEQEKERISKVPELSRVESLKSTGLRAGQVEVCQVWKLEQPSGSSQAIREGLQESGHEMDHHSLSALP